MIHALGKLNKTKKQGRARGIRAALRVEAGYNLSGMIPARLKEKVI